MNIVDRMKALALADDPITIDIKDPGDTATINTLFTGAVNIIALVAGIIAFFYLVYSGILYLTAAGNPDAAKKGQQGLINAIIGIVIIVAAWAIFRAVVNRAGDIVG